MWFAKHVAIPSGGLIVIVWNFRRTSRNHWRVFDVFVKTSRYVIKDQYFKDLPRRSQTLPEDIVNPPRRYYKLFRKLLQTLPKDIVNPPRRNYKLFRKLSQTLLEDIETLPENMKTVPKDILNSSRRYHNVLRKVHENLTEGIMFSRVIHDTLLRVSRFLSCCS